MRKFITLAMLMLFPTAVNAESLIGAWTFEEKKDPMTDVGRGIAYSKGDGGIIIFKCDRNGPGSTYIHLLSDKYLGSLGDVSAVRNMDYRVDSGPIIQSKWIHVKDAAMLVREQFGQFANNLQGGKLLILRATTYDNESVTYQFNISGFTEMLKSVKSSCHDA